MSEEKEIFSKIGKHNFLEEHFEAIEAEAFAEESKLIARIGYKLPTARYGIIIAGIITAVAGRNLVAIIVGVCLVVLGVYLLIKMKDFPTMDIYEKALVLYTSPEGKKVVRIPYEDINQWSIENKEGQMSAIKLIMNSGLTVYQPTFQLDKAARHLSQLIYEKETRIINKKEALKKKLELPRFLRNIIKK